MRHPQPSATHEEVIVSIDEGILKIKSHGGGAVPITDMKNFVSQAPTLQAHGSKGSKEFGQPSTSGKTGLGNLLLVINRKIDFHSNIDRRGNGIVKKIHYEKVSVFKQTGSQTSDKALVIMERTMTTTTEYTDNEPGKPDVDNKENIYGPAVKNGMIYFEEDDYTNDEGSFPSNKATVGSDAQREEITSITMTGGVFEMVDSGSHTRVQVREEMTV